MKQFVLYFLLTCIFLFSCRQESEFNYPLIFVGEITGIDSTGAFFNAKITDLGKSDIIDFGFVWGTKKKPEVGSSEYLLIKEKAEIRAYSSRISTSLKSGTKYFVRAFIRHLAGITYSKELVFTSKGSLGPIITEFYPKFGNIGDTITITGENFSYILNSNVVKIGGHSAKVIYSSQDSLKVIIPDNTEKFSRIYILIQGNLSETEDFFELRTPEILDFEPKTGAFGTQIKVSVANLSELNAVKVSFGDFQAKIEQITSNFITVKVPDDLNVTSCVLKIYMNGLPVNSVDSFHLQDINLTDFSPKVAVTGSTIKITGDNFSNIPKNNTVYFGKIKGIVSTSSSTEIYVILPSQESQIYDSRDVRVSVESCGRRKTFSYTLSINDKWFRLKDSPFGFDGAFVCTYKNKAYIGINVSNSYSGINNPKGLWMYNPDKDEYSRMAEFPGANRISGNGFRINDKIYFGTGREVVNNQGNIIYRCLNDFWEYDIPSDLWREIPRFPGKKRQGTLAFATSNSGYFACGMDDGTYPVNDLWKFDPLDNSWDSLASYSIYNPEGFMFGVSVVIGNKAYIGVGFNEKWYEYDEMANGWTQLAKFPAVCNYSEAMAFSLNNKAYVKALGSDFYCYESLTNSWEKIKTDIPVNFTGIAFSIGTKAYIGISNNLWEYDPSR